MMKLWLLLFFLPLTIVKDQSLKSLEDGRTPTSQSAHSNKNKREVSFLRASLLLEMASNNEIPSSQRSIYQPYLDELKNNLTVKDRQTYWTSLAALIIFNHQFEDMQSYTDNIQHWFSDERECQNTKECLFYLNLQTKLAEHFDSINLSAVLKQDHSGLSPFWSLIRRKVKLQNIYFENNEEEKKFQYIFESTLAHIYWNFNLKKDLHPIANKGYFDQKDIRHISSKIDELTEEIEGLTKNSKHDLEKKQEITELLIEPDYSEDKLSALVEVWQYRNKLLKGYLTRFEYRSIKNWYQDSELQEEIKNTIIARYSWFEVKLPTRKEVLSLSKNFDLAWKTNYQEQVQLTNEMAIEFARTTYPEFANKDDAYILSIEQALFQKQQFSSQEFFGFYHDMQINMKLSLTFISEAEKHAEKVKKGDLVYHGSFDYYYKMQEFDLFWLQGQCQVGQYIGQGLRNDRFTSPISKKKYLQTKVCPKNNQDLRDHLTHLFGVKKALNAAADEFLLGKSSTALSVIGYMSASRITAKAMGPILKYSAKKTASKRASLAYVKSLKDLNKSNILPWIKYVGAPALIVDYIGNAIIMTFVRSNLMTAIDYSTGKSKDVIKSFGSYVKSYTIMYLSAPPLGYFVTKAGKLVSATKALVPGFNSTLRAAKNIKLPSKVTKFAQGTYNVARENLVETIKFLPVYYVYDLVDYVEKGSAPKPSMQTMLERTGEISTWMIIWQALNHCVTRRQGPSMQELQSHSQKGN